jgi:hypothetical protein
MKFVLMLFAVMTSAAIPEHSIVQRNEATHAATLQWADTTPTPDLAPPTIAGKDHYDLGEKISFRFDGTAPDNAEIAFAWSVVSDESVETERHGAAGDELYVWTTHPGAYEAQLLVTYQIAILKPGPKFKEDKTDLIESTLTLSLPTLKHVFVVGTPEPEPEPEPKPEPTPGPKPGSLGALIESAQVRASLVEFFADLAGAVRDGAFTTTSHFRAAYRKAIADAKAQGELPIAGLSAIDKPISDRIAGAIGLADAAIDEAKKTQLAMTLDQVSEEFRDAAALNK